MIPWLHMRRQTGIRGLMLLLAVFSTSACGTAGPEGEPIPMPTQLPALEQTLVQSAKQVCEDVSAQANLVPYQSAVIDCRATLEDFMQHNGGVWPSPQMRGEWSLGRLAANEVLQNWGDLGMVNPQVTSGGDVMQLLLARMKTERLELEAAQTMPGDLVAIHFGE